MARTTDIFLSFMEHAVLQHREGSPALVAAAGWLTAAHAIRAANSESNWGKAAEEIATRLEGSYLDGLETWRSKQAAKAKQSTQEQGRAGKTTPQTTKQSRQGQRRAGKITAETAEPK
jgi:hypothetical protein